MHELRKTYVVADAIPSDKQFLLSTPKHIRDGALEDLTIAYKTNLAKRKENPHHTFDVKYRSKKDNQSMIIPHASVVNDTDTKQIRMYPTYLSNKIKYHVRMRDMAKEKNLRDIMYDCRMTMDKLGRMYLCVPQCATIASSGDTQALETDNERAMDDTASIDPGVRTFLTVYSPRLDRAYKIGDKDMGRIMRLCLHMDAMYGRLAKLPKKGKKHRSLQRAIVRLGLRIKHLVDEVHWKAIWFLCNNFKEIIIPPFNVSQMVRKGQRKINAKCVRSMLTWRHYVFRQRLVAKASLLGVEVHIKGEEHTTKTCTNCMNIHPGVGGAKVYHCRHCGVKVDRDVNGSRNIFLKNVMVES